MDIQAKFEKGSSNNTYQRIDPNYKVNIFLGYNDDGQMSMVITENAKEQRIKSSKLIDVRLQKREDGKLALSFDLLDSAYKSMFLIFCKDIIYVCEAEGKNKAISAATVRWKYWKEMFGKKKPNILDKMSIKGLVGELIMLQDFFIPVYGEDKALESWMGPYLGHKDFEIENTWYEIKAIAENATQVKISSLEQLDSEINGHLCVIRLEDTSAVSDYAINLNYIVNSVAHMLTNPDNISLLFNKLDSMGYSYDEEYDKYAFSFKGKEVYQVVEDFPRITRNDVDDAIGNVSYTLLLNPLRKYREE